MAKLNHVVATFTTTGKPQRDHDTGTRVAVNFKEKAVAIDSDFHHGETLLAGSKASSDLDILEKIDKKEVEAGHCTTSIHIDPNGNNTWAFNYVCRLEFDDGSFLEKNEPDHWLSDEIKDNTYQLKPPWA